MKVKPIKSFPVDRLGMMFSGIEYDVSDEIGNMLASMRLVTKVVVGDYQTKVESQAVETKAETVEIAEEKRRGRPKKQ